MKRLRGGAARPSRVEEKRRAPAGGGRRRPPGSAPGEKPASRHPHASSAPRPVGVAVITVSDSRGADRDASGDRIRTLVQRAGHLVVSSAWVKDEITAVRRAARAALADPRVDAVIATGGSGPAPRDRTPEGLNPLVDTWLPGFGELFRMLSFEHVGSAAWLSRASAGVARGRLVVLLPGSPKAIDLAMRAVLLPELAHVVRLLGRFQDSE